MPQMNQIPRSQTTLQHYNHQISNMNMNRFNGGSGSRGTKIPDRHSQASDYHKKNGGISPPHLTNLRDEMDYGAGFNRIML